jgi:hypothetical protein
MPGFHIVWIQDHTHVLISVYALRCPPILGVTCVFVMFLVEELYYLRIFIDGEHRCWVTLVPDNALPIMMRFYRDTDLLSDEVADIFAASVALLEAVRIDI